MHGDVPDASQQVSGVYTFAPLSESVDAQFTEFGIPSHPYPRGISRLPPRPHGPESRSPHEVPNDACQISAAAATVAASAVEMLIALTRRLRRKRAEPSLRQRLLAIHIHSATFRSSSQSV